MANTLKIVFCTIHVENGKPVFSLIPIRFDGSQINKATFEFYIDELDKLNHIDNNEELFSKLNKKYNISNEILWVYYVHNEEDDDGIRGSADRYWNDKYKTADPDLI